MEITGGCHCGKIRFRAKVDPDRVVICHCTDCQVLTGCAYRISVPSKVEDYVMLAGKEKVYVKVADSGARRAQAFCPDCATPLYAADATNPTSRTIRLGCVDQRAQLRPRKQIWFRSALPWSQNISDVAPKVDGQT